ncbi:hypothetical protein G6321_00052025 [Bradyrhizobium barranii subsp. barranii]|uniref:Uncharacterized protein n=1 Tax=Bradyrhizobium barranii subsp. barranii TaxID=2823807 RepID=A0A9X9YST9_9BRAD|nr:hypothetical protein G6321_00052025 [Bradyrhizobium barranii subsp. barranii]
MRTGKLLDHAADTFGLRQRILHHALQIGPIGRNRRELVAVVLDLAHVEQERGQGAIELAGDGAGHLVGGLGADRVQAGEIELFGRSRAAFEPFRRPRIGGRIVL